MPGTYWAVATLHTAIASYPCFSTLRLTPLSNEVADAGLPPRAPGLRLDPAAPNPFRAITALGYEVPSAGLVRLRILDLSGRAVATLVDGHRPAGRHHEAWQGRTDAGSPMGPGIYFVRLDQGGAARQVKVVRVN